ncbi:MAG: DUF2776 family protein [Alistipes sp.]|nr:DUF2776 family protein [Alistipes sp.]
MNYGISILFRAIPLLMALFCFFYGGYIYAWGDDTSRLIAGPVVFFLGSICVALFATAATIIRQIIHTYTPFARYFLPILGYLMAVGTFLCGIFIFRDTLVPSFFVAGHVICGLGLITGCVATAATVSTRFSLIPTNSAQPDLTVNPKGFSQMQELLFEGIAALFALVAWGWTFVLLSTPTTPHFVAGSVMGGIACVCTSLIALVASIVRQERNVYTPIEKRAWPQLVLWMGSVATVWGIILVLLYLGEPRNFVGFVLIGLGLVCFSISSKVILLAKIWKSDFPLASRIPIIPIMTALAALFLAAFLFEEALYKDKFFVPSRVLTGLGAICFTLYSIVSILESGTKKS